MTSTSTATGASSVKQGIAIDPYIVGAVFQEVAADGATVLQRQSSASDDNGVFTFPQPLTPGSTVEMKASNKGLHGGAPFQGMLRRHIGTDEAISVAVTPLTTMLAQGINAEDALSALNSAGFSGLTVDELYGNPMSGLQNRTGGVTDQELELLQAAMAVEAYMETTGNFQPTLTDLTDSSQARILNDMALAVRTELNSSEFNRVCAALAADLQITGQVALDDLILAVVKQQQTLIAQVRDQMANSGSYDSAMVDQSVQNNLNQVTAMVKEQYMARAPQTTPADGSTLYADNCAGCHGSLANSSKAGRTADQIAAAISDVTMMNSSTLKALTAADIQAIADALAGTVTPPPPAPADGQTLYADNCAGCHGDLASSSKTGRTATDIQDAIANVSSMKSLNFLTSSEIQAIADVLPAPPAPDPGTPPDGVALYNSECAGCHGPLATTEKPGRTASQIQDAINNVGSMRSLSTLTSAEVQAIADVLPAAPPPPATPDGAALYASYCAGCHGALAGTNKPGRTAAQIQTAINNVGSMGSLSSLTTSEIQAIADVLPAGAPGPDYSDCTACHGQPPAGNSYPNVAGAHAFHNSLASVNNNCATCHIGADHNGTVDLGIAATFNAKSGAAAANSNNTCSSVSCHGGQTTPNWQTGTIAVETQCTSCHASGTGQYNGFYSGQHNRHVSRGYACTVCHNTTKLAAGHFSNLSTSSFEQDPAATIGGGGTSVGSYTPSASTPSSGTCSSVACHSSHTW